MAVSLPVAICRRWLDDNFSVNDVLGDDWVSCKENDNLTKYYMILNFFSVQHLVAVVRIVRAMQQVLFFGGGGGS